MSAPTFKKTKVKQKINLEEEFGVDFKGRRSLREAIGGAIIERIRKRTEAGQGISFTGDQGRPVKLKAPYSKTYASTLDFKAAGKSRGNVNMKLTGDMLGLMDIVSQDGNSITIGWSDREENAKAYNHSVGDTVPKRPFFGVSKKELSEIKREFSDEIAEAQKRAQDKEASQSFEARIAALFKFITGE